MELGWPVTKDNDIYAIRCSKTGRVYIGRTYNLRRRVQEHFAQLRRGEKIIYGDNGISINTAFQEDYNQYGEESFEVYVLETVKPENCEEREAFWISEYQATNPEFGYNKRDERFKLEGTFSPKYCCPPKPDAPEPWTGELIGKMHNAKVTYDDLAAEVGCGKAYICAILNSRRKPPNAREKLFAAFDSIVKRRGENG